MEAEISAILNDAVRSPDDSPGLAEALLTRFGDLGGVDLELPPPAAAPRGADLST